MNNGGLYLFNTESTAVEIYMHWLVATRGWLKFIEWYSKWLAQAHQMMGMSTSDNRHTVSSRCMSSGWCMSSSGCRCGVTLLMGMGVEEQVHVEGQVHIEWPVHVEWQAHIKQLVHIEQWAQVRHHIVVDGNGIKGDGGGCCAFGNGDGAEWHSWVLWWV